MIRKAQSPAIVSVNINPTMIHRASFDFRQRLHESPPRIQPALRTQPNKTSSSPIIFRQTFKQTIHQPTKSIQIKYVQSQGSHQNSACRFNTFSQISEREPKAYINSQLNLKKTLMNSMRRVDDIIVGNDREPKVYVTTGNNFLEDQNKDYNQIYRDSVSVQNHVMTEESQKLDNISERVPIPASNQAIQILSKRIAQLEEDKQFLKNQLDKVISQLNQKSSESQKIQDHLQQTQENNRKLQQQLADGYFGTSWKQKHDKILRENDHMYRRIKNLESQIKQNQQNNSLTNSQKNTEDYNTKHNSPRTSDYVSALSAADLLKIQTLSQNHPGGKETQ